jgi:hypothetical protein
VAENCWSFLKKKQGESLSEIFSKFREKQGESPYEIFLKLRDRDKGKVLTKSS